MARSPLRPCRKAGCNALTRDAGGYCAAHQALAARPRKASESWHGWYRLPIWVRDLRPAQLMREPFCRACAADAERLDRPELQRVRATVVDHIEPHRGDWARFTDRGNLESLCAWHHNRKTMRELNETMRQAKK